MSEEKIGKIQINRDLCIGCGSCVALCPEVFDLDSEGKEVIKNPQGAPLKNILEVAQACPVSAISVKKE